jgi:prefoldin subunit 5
MNKQSMILPILVFSLSTGAYAENNLSNIDFKLENIDNLEGQEKTVMQLIQKKNAGVPLTKLEEAMVDLYFEEEKSKELDRSIAKIEKRIDEVKERIDDSEED